VHAALSQRLRSKADRRPPRLGARSTAGNRAPEPASRAAAHVHVDRTCSKQVRRGSTPPPSIARLTHARLAWSRPDPHVRDPLHMILHAILALDVDFLQRGLSSTWTFFDVDRAVESNKIVGRPVTSLLCPGGGGGGGHGLQRGLRLRTARKGHPCMVLPQLMRRHGDGLGQMRQHHQCVHARVHGSHCE
jgi:hypothetical protein